MREFEVLLLLALSISVIGFCIPRTKRPHFWLYIPGLTVFFALVHIWFEGYRFQMVLGYILTLILFMISVFQFKGKSRVEKQASRGCKILGVVLACLGILLLALAIIFPALMPVVNLPEPGGPYSVGKTSFHFVDKSRLEALTEKPDDYREFYAHVWYPSEPAKGSKVLPYRIHQPRVGSILEAGSDLTPGGPPDFVFSHFK